MMYCGLERSKVKGKQLLERAAWKFHCIVSLAIACGSLSVFPQTQAFDNYTNLVLFLNDLMTLTFHTK